MNEIDAEKKELWTKLGLLLGVNMTAVNNVVTETTLESHGGNVGAGTTSLPKEQAIKCSKCGAMMTQGTKSGLCDNCSGTMNSLGKGNHGIQKRSTHALEVSSKADAMSQALQDGMDDKLGHPDAAQVHKEAADAHMVAAKEASVPGATKGSSDFMKAGFHKNKAEYHLQQAKFHAEQDMPPVVTAKSSGSGINEAPVNQDPPAITQNPTGQLAANADELCPECGGPMVDGECEECGVDEGEDDDTPNDQLERKEEPAMNRHELISHLVTNCSCWKGEDDVLNELTDDKLKALKAKLDREALLEKIANAANEGFTGEDGMAYRINSETGNWQRRRMVANQSTVLTNDSEMGNGGAEGNGDDGDEQEEEITTTDQEGQIAPTNGKGQKPMIERDDAVKNIQARLTANGASQDDVEAVENMPDSLLLMAFNAPIPPALRTKMKKQDIKRAPAIEVDPSDELTSDDTSHELEDDGDDDSEGITSFGGKNPMKAGSTQVGGKGVSGEYLKNKPTKNSYTPSKAAKLSDDDKDALRHAWEITNRERNHVANQLRLIANGTQVPGKKKRILNYLNTRPNLDSLRSTLELAQEFQPVANQFEDQSYMGANAPLSVNQDSGAGDDVLDLPTLQFNEETKEMDILLERAKRRHA